ncbi:hypothetical protein [Arthrobacter crystallopoietes]|uniref:PD-(D/E)XK nuclease superfamily protein n=1 Tax=Crystallibacter crystallopoietes TaxID=37928 RepID=A0A1H0XLG9_9MICC|nr:hypothetical protein [Arthrobacter crystallopoietes]SDQ03722.1 hypothetical protein SAMN04489742_0157 [Arthrobacter crystallopoietes]
MIQPAEPAPFVDETDEETGGGQFTIRGRQSAINSVLPLLVTYFADAQTWSLEVSKQLASSRDDVLDDLATAARLRASLAAAERLLGILGEIGARPTFRYTQTNAESVGAIRGRLDLPRYIREQGRISVPRRYPVRLVERENATPENVLAAYAAHWISRDLESIPDSLLPPKSPEKRDLNRLREGLERSLGLPLLAGTTPHAMEVWRRSSLPVLLEQVEGRLDAGHVASPEPYRELAEWISETLRGQTVAEVGDREWSFYDARFDTKLFEIWCLYELAKALTKLLGDPETSASSLAARRKGPLYEWKIGAGKLRLYFQASLADLSEDSTVWSFKAGATGKLRGFPDIAVTADTVAGHGLVILDPKLRRRPNRAPTEELYKLLGYFGNLKHPGPPLGVIFYYSPGSRPYYKLTSGENGELHALGLDPETGSQAAFEVAAEIAIKAAALQDRALEAVRSSIQKSQDSPEENTAALQQIIAVETMRSAAKSVAPAGLSSTSKATSTALRSIWGQLSSQTQTMIVTAEYFGLDAPPEADHSGPLLGLAAAFELTLHEHIFIPAAGGNTTSMDTSLTLGRQLRILDDALRSRRSPESEPIQRFFQHKPADVRQLLRVVRDAKRMNREYRVPAAHAYVISQSTWADGREFILDARSGILVRLIKSLEDVASSSPI